MQFKNIQLPPYKLFLNYNYQIKIKLIYVINCVYILTGLCIYHIVFVKNNIAINHLIPVMPNPMFRLNHDLTTFFKFWLGLQKTNDHGLQFALKYV